jgi:hypothetical protein
MDNVYLCINALETKSLMFQFPLSIMHAERKAHMEMFPDNDEKEFDSEMVRRLQVRISEAVLRMVNEPDCDMVNLYPRNYYMMGSRGIETENGTSPHYIPICDAKLYTTNHVPTQVQIYFMHTPDTFESEMQKIEVGKELTLEKESESEKEYALELYMSRLMAYHLERGAQF